MSDAALFLPLPDDDTLYAALLARDPPTMASPSSG